MSIYALASVLLVSAVSLVGTFALSLKTELLKKYIFILVSLAIGALLGDSFIHLIPEAAENISDPTLLGVLIISGVMFFFVLEKILHWHHHHGAEKDGCDHIHPVGRLILFSDGIHNFLDGFIIGASYLAGIEIGIATTLAIIIHEIPQEIADFGVLIHAGYSKSRALFLNFLTALAAVLGTILALILSVQAETLINWSVPIVAGGFIYIALSDLIPELNKKSENIWHSLLQLFIIVIGVLMMLALIFIEN